MSRAVHVFFDVNMSASHRALTEIVSHVAKRGELKAGECAIFLNCAWDACKILYPDGVIIYWRSPTGSPIGLDSLRFLPTRLASKLELTGKGEASVLKEFERRFQKRMARLNVAYA